MTEVLAIERTWRVCFKQVNALESMTWSRDQLSLLT